MKMKRIFLVSLGVIVIAAVSLLVVQSVPAHVLADAKGDVCEGVGAVSGKKGCTGGTPLTTTVRNATNIVSAIVGMIAVIMFVINGARLIISRGDASRVTGARDGITYAIVGLIVVALAQTVVQFVIGNV